MRDLLNLMLGWVLLASAALPYAQQLCEHDDDLEGL